MFPYRAQYYRQIYSIYFPSTRSRSGDNEYSIRKSKGQETRYLLIIPIGEDVIKRLHQNIWLFWRTRITSSLRIDSKLRGGNIELDLFTTQSQSSYSRTRKRKYINQSEKKKIIYICGNKDLHIPNYVWIWPFRRKENKVFKNSATLIKISSMTTIATLLTSLPDLSLQTSAILRQSYNTINSTYMDNNNLYQSLIQKKTILFPVISFMRSDTDKQTTIKHWPDRSPTVTKGNFIFLVPVYAEMDQHIISINKTGLQ